MSLDEILMCEINFDSDSRVNVRVKYKKDERAY